MIEQLLIRGLLNLRNRIGIMIDNTGEDRPVLQTLNWGAVREERMSPPGTMFAQTGRRMYVIGDIDGGFRPRSNPYDLHAFGQPHPQDPLANKLQGVWAQPVKGLDRYSYSLLVDGERWNLDQAGTFTQAYAWVQFAYRRGEIKVFRRDFIPHDLPILISILTLENTSEAPVEISTAFQAVFDLEDAWFTKLGSRRNQGEIVTIEAGRLVARAEVLPDRWCAAAGCKDQPDDVRLLEGSAGEVVRMFTVKPGEQKLLTFGVSVESEGGAPAALEMLERGLRESDNLLIEKIALYDRIVETSPRLSSPDHVLNNAFALAQANLQMLENSSPLMGRYFFAGLEMFPFWFSNDGAYSISGLMAAGLRDSAINHLRLGMLYQEEGRVPHQISPSGKIAFSGNAQETPQWVMSIWDAYRWTGDSVFLAEMYPGAHKGMFDYVLNIIDPDGDGYPSGPGMVEAEGMGAEKLDSAAYTWAALQVMEKMAAVLGDRLSADKAHRAAERISTNFESDWWNEPGATYAMSLDDPGNALRPIPHWAVIVPLEVGLASAKHAAVTFATLREQYLNEWGLKHTVGDDERVWTLPTATLSRAAFRYGEDNLGREMLAHIASTLDAGSIGLFHELIPEGACIIQLWSAATFLRGVIEDLFGVEVQAAQHAVRISPRLPLEWEEAALEDLAFGEHIISLHLCPGGDLAVTHVSGPAVLRVTCAQGDTEFTFDLAPGETREVG
jgi:glycogen debranching enzyme